MPGSLSTAVLRIRGGKPLIGQVRLPVDLEVAQRALVIAALGTGRSQLQGIPTGSDLDRTVEILRALGVPITTSDSLAVDGVGLYGLTAPSSALDCGRGLATLALTAGLLAGQRFGTRVTVHPSLAARALEHLVGPLRARGAQIAGRSDPSGNIVAPLAIAPLVGDERLRALDCSLPLADPAAKTAVLISALFADGTTTLAEPLVSADHTERLMVALGLPLRRIGSVVAFDPGEWTREIPPLGSVTMPGSATIAAYLAAVAQHVQGSDITLDDVAINPTRSGVLDVIRQWGGAIAIRPSGEAALREPIGELRARARRLRGGVLGAEELVRSQGEIAALLLLGAGAHRNVELLDLDAIAPAASPHWQALRELFGAFGLPVEAIAGGLRVAANSSGLRPARVDVRGSAELAIAAAALALVTPGESVLENAAEALASSHPGFRDTARALGGEIELS